ncbi:MAG: nucleotidyltransferase [Actinobacteria bacterium]|nr:MAG: nucleotidyltransferase [Actinomycetota bacterium]RIK02664.1 MAG: nucleotidyltransferase [Acidobacteriota bacterium]
MKTLSSKCDTAGVSHAPAAVDNDGTVEIRPGIAIDDEHLASFCERHHIRSLALFGSATGDRFSPDSDIDLLVAFEPGASPGLLSIAEMELELGAALGREVDLRTANDLSRLFRDRVVAEARTLYAA